MRKYNRILCGLLATSLLMSSVPVASASEVPTDTNTNIENSTNEIIEEEVKQKEYFVTFMDGSNIIDTQKIKAGEAAISPQLTKDGYTLKWSRSFDKITDDMIVNAVWVKNAYTVTFMDGNNIVKTQKVEYGQSAKVPSLYKVGYTLSWDVEVNNVTSDIVVHAVWTPTIYTINYVTGDAVNDANNPTTYTFGQEFDLQPLKLEGYTFGGWYSNADYSGSKLINVPSTTFGNKTFYAKWNKVKVSKVSVKKAKLSSKKTNANIKWKTVKGAKKYVVEVSTDKEFKDNIIRKTTKKNTTTIKKLEKDKIYYVRVKAYKKDSTNKKVYGEWSKIKTIK